MASKGGEQVDNGRGKVVCSDPKKGMDKEGNCVRKCPDGSTWKRKLNRCMCDDERSRKEFKEDEDEKEPAWENKGTCR